MWSINVWDALVGIFLINALCGNPIADICAAIRGCPQVTNNFATVKAVKETRNEFGSCWN